MKNGSKVYFCSRISEPQDAIEKFDKPVEYTLRPNYLTIQPAGGYMDFQNFGEFVNITHNGYATPYEKWINTFKEGDRVYINKVPNGFKSDIEPELGWGNDANAKIIAVKGQNKAVRLTIQDIVE